MTVTWKQILEIRRSYALPKTIRPTQWDLAQKYNMSQALISLIVNRKVYTTPNSIRIPYAAPIDHPLADALAEMYLSNIPVAEIAQKLRMSRATMYRLLREMDIPLRNKTSPRKAAYLRENTPGAP